MSEEEKPLQLSITRRGPYQYRVVVQNSKEIVASYDMTGVDGLLQRLEDLAIIPPGP